MDPDRYPVAWQDKDGNPITLGLGPLSAGVTKAFCNWCKPRMWADAMEWMDGAGLKAFRQELTAGGVYWDESGPCSGVAQLLGTKDGSLYLNRLLFGDDVKGWSDAQLWAFLRAKDRKKPTQEDPSPVQSDYAIAFDLVWDAAHPKVRAPTGATPANSSGTPLSTQPATSVAPTHTTGSSVS